MALEFPNIDPVAFSIGPLSVRWYALSYLAGFLIGWRYALSLLPPLKNPVPPDDKSAFRAWRSQGERPNRLDIDDFLTAALLGVILGGRFGYVLFYNFDGFLNDPIEIFKIWQGGMSFHGGAIGVIAAIFIFSALQRINPLKLADIVVCAVPVGLFLGRLANFINGELYGRATDVWWAVKFPAGGGIARHPSQLYEALLEGLVLFAVLWIMARRQWVRARPGLLSAVFLAGYGMSRAIVELFREPDAHIGLIAGGLSMGQLLSLPMIVAGGLLAIYAVYNQSARA